MILELDWSVFHGLNWVPYAWDTSEVLSIKAHEYIRQENRKDVSVVHEDVAV